MEPLIVNYPKMAQNRAAFGNNVVHATVYVRRRVSMNPGPGGVFSSEECPVISCGVPEPRFDKP